MLENIIRLMLESKYMFLYINYYSLKEQIMGVLKNSDSFTLEQDENNENNDNRNNYDNNN
jgi:hypothetical protein